MPTSIQDFIETLAVTGIPGPDDIPKQGSNGPFGAPTDDAQELALTLVRLGKLTRFQASALYAGKGKALVCGDYLIHDKLGAGGMGQVYKAQHRKMKRLVALKILPARSTRSPHLVERFYQEVRTAARLVHPNVVTAFDAGESEGQHYLVMELVEGRDLSSVAKNGGKLPWTKAVDYMLQAACGLEYAHRQGIVHRDVKPANLLLDQYGTVKVLDMGLARIDDAAASADAAATEGLTQAGEIMGTCDYMAPEQARDSRTADHRADIYSLGCTLFRLVTGRVPYGGDTTVKKILAHREEPTPELKDVSTEVPSSLSAICLRMMAKQPDERYQSMAEVIADFEGCLNGTMDLDDSLPVTESAADEDGSLKNFLSQLGDQSAPRRMPSGGNAATATAPAPVRLTRGNIRQRRPKQSNVWIVGGACGGVAASALVLAVALGGSRDKTTAPATQAGGVAVATAQPFREPTRVEPTNPLSPAARQDPAKQAELPEGPVGFWSFDDHSSPGKGKMGGANAQLRNVAVERGLAGIGGVRFHGKPSESLVLGLGLASDVLFRGLTVELMLAPSWKKDPDAIQTLFCKGDDIVLAAGPNPAQATSGTSTPALWFSARLASGPLTVVLPLDGCDGRPSIAKLADGHRHHLAATYQAADGELSLAIDGVRQAHLQAGNESRLVGSAQPLLAGNSPAGNQPFAGTIDELALWNCALHRSEIGTHWQRVQVGRDYFDQPTDSGLAGLLKQVDVTKSSAKGNWIVEDGAIVSSSAGTAQLKVATSPGSEYEATVTVERRDGEGALVLGLPIGDSQVAVVINPGKEARIGLEQFDGESEKPNASHKEAGELLPQGMRRAVSCQVSRDGFRVFCDGKEVLEWHGDVRRLSLGKDWAAKAGELFLGTRNASYAILDLEVRPLKAK